MIYTKDTIDQRLPWVEIHDWEFFVLGRTLPGGPTAKPAHATTDDGSGHTPYWGFMSENPIPTVRRIEKTHPSERLVVIGGTVQVESEHGRFSLQKRDYVDVPESGLTLTSSSAGAPEIAWIKGDWERTIRTEVFFAQPGMPCDYHYHDGNEYWVIFRGNFTLDFAGRRIPVGPGTLMAGGMGLEHGALDPEQPLSAIVMAMPLEGRGRDGHLNREMHGDPVVGREIPDSEWARLDAMSVGEVTSRVPVVRS